MNQDPSSMISQIIQDMNQKIPDLEAIYLFGSRVDSEGSVSNDWDFAFLSRKGLKPFILWEFRSELEAKYEIDIDLIDFYQVDTVFQHEIINKGKVIWCKNLETLHFTEALATSFYQKLNQERMEILSAVKERGSIYG